MDLILVSRTQMCVVHSRWDMSEKTKYVDGTSKDTPPAHLPECFFLWLTKEKALQLSITTDKEALPHYINAVKLKTQFLGQSCVQGPPPEKLPRLQQQSFGKTLHLLPCGKQWKLKWDKNQSSHLPRPALHSRAEWVLTKTIELGKMCLSVLLVTVGYSWPVINSFLVLFCIKRQCANSN